jgi:hypothetical protein
VDDMNPLNSLNKSSSDGREAFELLALRYLDGLHTEEESRQLNEQLAASAESRELFAALSLEIAILKEMSLSETDDSDRASPSERSSATGAPLAFAESNPLDPAADEGWLPRLWPMQWVLAAGVVIGGVGVWAFKPGLNEQTEPAVATAANHVAPLEVGGVHIESGTTKLLLPKVGYVVVEGPAEFDLLGPKRARLKYGRIKMRVTEETGRGFVVETPDGEITDLGTEFGVNVGEGRKTGLVVFEGAVDLRVAESQPTDAPRMHLVGGEGVVFDKAGSLERIMSISTGAVSTFRQDDEAFAGESAQIITKVQDNLRKSETKKFYEIVPRGLNEDVRKYVDRRHEWNGLTTAGMPSYLVGADYVRTFNADSLKKNIAIRVTVSRPAKLYVFFDDRLKVPAWLSDQFRNTGDKIGGDSAYPKRKAHLIGKGPGVEVDDIYSVWERTVSEPGVVKLGASNIGGAKAGSASMYGIAATPLDVNDVTAQDSSDNSNNAVSAN